MYESLALLEKKFAMSVLMQIRDSPGQSKSELVETNGSVGRTKLTRINELIEAGLIETRKSDKRNKQRLYLTPEGQEIVSHVQPLSQILDRLCVATEE